MQKGLVPEDVLREVGLKVTPQRVAVLSALYSTDTHPSAAAVHRMIKPQMPGISLDTVNRILGLMADLGIIRVVEGNSGERRYDAELLSHHHLYCTRCGRIIDFMHKPYDGMELPPGLPGDFLVTGKKVVLEGYCGKCRNKTGKGAL